MIAAAVFDLDGTLVDTAPDLVATLNTVFAREGLPPVAYEAARNMVGGGARHMIERGLAAERRSLPVAEIDRLCRDFIDHYAAHIADRSRPFPGLEAALDELAGHGLSLIVCTNKLEWLSVRLLDALGLSSRFVAICGADTFGLKKPDPELLRRTLGRAGARAERAVMVGDSANDVDMARAAGVPVVAVDFGYTETPASELNADLVISAFRDLPKAIFGLLGNPVGARAETT
ncbi:MAG TPA: phosphoglycolate phosphatase [Xanthobacteraceae bacterium]|nr:phosphoglycolate phosphatase [Xanthobacteraceae bacterium]HZO47544.1 phosphoglycolate phosphatase [Xanthobacteraceae bacterium]